ncbi:hypothetical protein GOB93_18660 [Acetobacter musti]|uniref:Uncharacterized protein n=1 Tax=Acetobacter musti TaxID=864732 RepID=A0ABX0JT10_9PROT|nr:hypothetical protein [Acetobacter musti]NHN86633.1 hypothetical protein [Acetobacter musti]
MIAFDPDTAPSLFQQEARRVLDSGLDPKFQKIPLTRPYTGKNFGNVTVFEMLAIDLSILPMQALLAFSARTFCKNFVSDFIMNDLA